MCEWWPTCMFFLHFKVMFCCPFLFFSLKPVCFALLSTLRWYSMAWAVDTKALDVLFGHARSVDQQFLFICTVWRPWGRGNGRDWEGGGAKGHRWSKMMKLLIEKWYSIYSTAANGYRIVFLGASCLWLFLGHSVYTLRLGLVIASWKGWLWVGAGSDDETIIWYNYMLMMLLGTHSVVIRLLLKMMAHNCIEFLTHCHLGAVTNQTLLRNSRLFWISFTFQNLPNILPVYSASWGCFMEASWQASWHWPQRFQGFASNL